MIAMFWLGVIQMVRHGLDMVSIKRLTHTDAHTHTHTHTHSPVIHICFLHGRVFS